VDIMCKAYINIKYLKNIKYKQWPGVIIGLTYNVYITFFIQ